MLPKLPKSVLTNFGDELNLVLNAQLKTIMDNLTEKDTMKSIVYEQSKSIFRNNVNILHNVRMGKIDDVDILIKENSNITSELISRIATYDVSLREERLSTAMEGFILASMFKYFFTNGCLAPPSLVPQCSDEEYIGAAIGLAHELVRYAVGRACVCDTMSISLCTSLVSQLHESLLEFDFRNGPLRKKYDGLKYAQRRLEALTYELSLLQGRGGGDGSHEGPEKKRSRIETVIESTHTNAAATTAASTDGAVNEVSLAVTADREPQCVASIIPVDEFNAIQQRLRNYDGRREDVIKRSRDVQKLSKQAVFAVHRGALKEAATKIAAAKVIAEELMQTIALEPTLRAGSFSNSLEEWTEAKLLLDWVTDSRLACLQELPLVSAVEYLGALSDFTGEIGRLAVTRATSRDVEFVRRVLETDVVVSAALQSVQSLVGGQFFRKVEAATTNLKKVEEVVYELSVVQLGGRVASDRGTDEDATAAAGAAALTE